MEIDHLTDNWQGQEDAKNDNDTPMKTYLQINVYRLNGDTPEYLLVERSDGDQQFWQPLSQEVQGGAMLIDTLTAIMRDQAGINDFKHLSQAVYTYEWYTNGQQGRDIIFSAKVSADTTIQIKPEASQSYYVNYAWLPYEQALQQMKWNGNKEALRRLQAIIAQNIEAGVYADDDEADEPTTDNETSIEALSFGDPYAALRQPAATPQPQTPAAPRPKPRVIGLPLYIGPNASLPTDDEPVNLPVQAILQAMPNNQAPAIYTNNNTPTPQAPQPPSQHNQFGQPGQTY